MKINLSLFASSLLLFSFLSPCAAEDEDSPLANEMGQMSRNVRKLSRQFADPAQKASSLEIVAAIEKNVATAKTLTPSKAEKLPDAEKTKYLATFKKDIDALGEEVAVLKDAISSDKPDVAKAEMAKIDQMKNSSHKELGVKTGPPGGGRGRGGPGGPGGGWGGDRSPRREQMPPPAASPQPSPAP